jgi:hypothetical protein
MTKPLQLFSDLLDVARGRAPDDLGPAQRVRLAATAALSSLGFAAAWGVAAGATDPTLALSNAAKVPMVVLFSTLAAVPAGMLAHRLSGSTESTRGMLLSFSGCVFVGTLVAAVLAPLVAVYYLTSAWAGPYLGMGSAFLAVGVAGLLFLRGALRSEDRRARLIPKLVIAAVTLGVMPQFIHLASPILPEHTPFDEGIDVVDSVREVR